MSKSYYFGENIVKPVVMRIMTLRSEPEYDADPCPEKTALKYNEKIYKQLGVNIYLLNASEEVAASNKLRTKKRSMFLESHFQKLDSRSGEFEVFEGKTRLASLVNLNGFGFDTSEMIILNWGYSLVILSAIDIDTLYGYVDGWIDKRQKAWFPFNYDAIAHDLLSLDKTIVTRYFFADNGHNECLVIVGNENFNNLRA